MAGEAQHRGIGRGLLQFAGGEPVLAHDDLRALVHRPAVQHAGGLERGRIGPDGVMIGGEHGEGAVGQNPVEIVAGGVPPLAQDRVIGLHGKDHAVVGALGGPGANLVAQRLLACDPVKVEIAQLHRAAEKMHMAVD
jgi:hypothetical protein